MARTQGIATDGSEAEAVSIAQAGKTARPLSFQNTLLAMRATRQKAQNNSTFLYDFTLTTCRLCDTALLFLAGAMRSRRDHG